MYGFLYLLIFYSFILRLVVLNSTKRNTVYVNFVLYWKVLYDPILSVRQHSACLNLISHGFNNNVTAVLVYTLNQFCFYLIFYTWYTLSVKLFIMTESSKPNNLYNIYERVNSSLSTALDRTNIGCQVTISILGHF